MFPAFWTGDSFSPPWEASTDGTSVCWLGPASGFLQEKRIISLQRLHQMSNSVKSILETMILGQLPVRTAQHGPSHRQISQHSFWVFLCLEDTLLFRFCQVVRPSLGAIFTENVFSLFLIQTTLQLIKGLYKTHLFFTLCVLFTSCCWNRPKQLASCLTFLITFTVRFSGACLMPKDLSFKQEGACLFVYKNTFPGLHPVVIQSSK